MSPPPDSTSAPTAHARAEAAFHAAFGALSTHRAHAPGRINLIGEHTDYNGGFVLPTPISLHCVAAASIAKGPLTRFHAADIGESFAFDQDRDLSKLLDQPPPTGTPRGDWPSYVMGVLQGYLQAGFRLPPLDIAIASDIPIGAGLSSSAALESATANLVESITGRALPPLDKARLCRTAEHTFAGVPCGIMDQYAVILGQPGQALLIDCSNETAKLVPLPPQDQASVLIVDTQVRHSLADGEYAKRRQTCAAAAVKLGIPTLRQTTLAKLRLAGLSDEEFRCAAHVVTENARVLLAADALRRGDLPALGKLMYESHESLRDDYRVSCPELDTVVALARACPGVHGARMTGGGFGGCAIVLVNTIAAAVATRTILDGFRQVHTLPCRMIDGFGIAAA